MKKIYTTIAAIMAVASGFAQADTTSKGNDTTKLKTDTVRVGNFTIIKTTKSGNTGSNVEFQTAKKKPGKVSTNWFIFDLGFANTNDQTDYNSAAAKEYLIGDAMGPITKGDFKLRAIKSSNVNIWFVMQKVNLSKGYVNLKYGIGLEMFNFRYQSSINYANGSNPSIYRDTLPFTKNKLYAGYLTAPLMININTSPGTKKGFSFSAGVSAGYLVGNHDKQISGERGKEKTHGNIGLEQFRLAYVGEIGIGAVRLFGSYSITKLHEKGLEQYPYSMGIRFSRW